MRLGALYAQMNNLSIRDGRIAALRTAGACRTRPRARSAPHRFPTGLTEQDGIYYYVAHPDGGHALVVPDQQRRLISFTIQGEVDRDGGIQASYGDVRLRCDRCRP